MLRSGADTGRHGAGAADLPRCVPAEPSRSSRADPTPLGARRRAVLSAPSGAPGVHTAPWSMRRMRSIRRAIGPSASIGANVPSARDPRRGRGRDRRLRASRSGLPIAHRSTLSYALIGARRGHLFRGAHSGRNGSGSPSAQPAFFSLPQLGRVVLEDDVEIGASPTIDRGSLDDTVIGPARASTTLCRSGTT